MSRTINGPGAPGPARTLTRRQLVAGLGAAAVCVPSTIALARGAASSSSADASAASGGAVRAGDEAVVVLSDGGVTVNGEPAGSDSSAAVYVANDVVYYEDRDAYDSGNAYGEGSADERHSAADAAAVTVVHVTQAGTYRLSGTATAAQVWVDLGEDASEDPQAVVTLVLDGLDITCGVAPAIVFRSVYECCGGWSTDTATSGADTAAAGANVVIADGSQNKVTGSHVARIYKDSDEQKKLWKIDGAFYSFMSMNVDGGEEGTGSLLVVADNEGLDSELHLTVNGGNISILSQDDGINTNEDGVSVTTVNGGTLHIVAGLGSEGDGVDSNGWLVINGGTVISMANPASDSGLDSDMGSYVNGGVVVALGSTMDWAESDSDQVTMNLQFASSQSAGDAIVVTDEDGTVVFAYDPSEDETAGEHIRSYTGAVLSCPDFVVGNSYNVYVGGVVSGVEVQGVYDASTVSGYVDGTQQAYTGTDVQQGPGAGGPGMGEPPSGDGAQAPGGGQPGERPEGGAPDGGQPGEPPSDTPGDAGQGAEPPAEVGQKPADGAGAPGGSDTVAADDAAQAQTAFFMEDKVNAFSGVTAAA